MFATASILKFDSHCPSKLYGLLLVVSQQADDDVFLCSLFTNIKKLLKHFAAAAVVVSFLGFCLCP